MAGVYISFPFCGQKCTYCNFASGVFPKELEANYLQALGTEIHDAQWEWKPETLYIGGGTPSSLDGDTLAWMVSAVPGRIWREATLEAAPGTVTPERVSAWRAAGINRISLGVQSFVTSELQRTGRKHTSEVVASEVARLRDAGLGNINVDLIAGLPCQTESSWRESLDWIARLGIPHISVYMLEVDQDSRLGRELLLGGVRYGAADTPSDEQIVAFYQEAVDSFRSLGVIRYEISNFARPGFESKHNLKYWRLEPYLGFGADAHSFDGRRRWQNVESPSEYVCRLASGNSPIAEPAIAARADERFFVGLRLDEGIRPLEDEWNRFADPIGRFISQGLLTTDGSRIRLTDRGVLFSNEVFAEFVEQ
jgi:oxygen-independent coproporphyrinogen III oxidase